MAMGKLQIVLSRFLQNDDKGHLMKIAIISLYSRLGDKTGDMVQADKTASAICDLGHDAFRVYLQQNAGAVYDSDGVLLGRWEDALGDCDIVHAIPPIPFKFIKPLPRLKAKLVCSTVFWRSYTYTKVIEKVEGKLTGTTIKDYARTFLAWIGIPTYKVYQGYDLLLPNSEDEIRVLKRYCKISRETKIVAVPNAIDPMPNDIDRYVRPDCVPKEDYVLVPGVFASRKNQLMFIRAMKDFPHPIVFIGDGPYLEKCRSEAGPTMSFLGYIAHGTKEFYSILKYARVVCLPSNCETPGIAGLEAAAVGARPVVPYEGGTCQYYGWNAEYLGPLSATSMRRAVNNAWGRGRISADERELFVRMTWSECAKMTAKAYSELM